MMHSCVTFVLLCCVVLTAFILDLKFILKMALETKECGKEKNSPFFPSGPWPQTSKAWPFPQAQHLPLSPGQAQCGPVARPSQVGHRAALPFLSV
jgi:hypothetical protein